MHQGDHWTVHTSEDIGIKTPMRVKVLPKVCVAKTANVGGKDAYVRMHGVLMARLVTAVHMVPLMEACIMRL